MYKNKINTFVFKSMMICLLQLQKTWITYSLSFHMWPKSALFWIRRTPCWGEQTQRTEGQNPFWILRFSSKINMFPSYSLSQRFLIQPGSKQCRIYLQEKKYPPIIYELFMNKLPNSPTSYIINNYNKNTPLFLLTSEDLSDKLREGLFTVKNE